MLNYFYDKELIKYSQKEITDWREGIQESCEGLLAKGLIDQSYVAEIINNVATYGPYIVIVPQVAIPHAAGESQGVFGTAIAFTKMKKAIVFDIAGEHQEATLFFTLAAENMEKHLTNMVNLSELLMREGLIARLIQTNSLEDYQEVMKDYQ